MARKAIFLASVRADLLSILTYIGRRFEVVNIIEGHRDIDAHFGERDAA
jgi:hypothetical protein